MPRHPGPRVDADAVALRQRLEHDSLFDAYDSTKAHFVTYAFRDPGNVTKWIDGVYTALHAMHRSLDWSGMPPGFPHALPAYAGTILDRKLAAARWYTQGDFEVEAVTVAFPSAELQQQAYDTLTGTQPASGVATVGVDEHRDPPRLYSLPPQGVLTPRSILYLGGYAQPPQMYGGGRIIMAQTEEQWHALLNPFPAAHQLDVITNVEEQAASLPTSMEG